MIRYTSRPQPPKGNTTHHLTTIKKLNDQAVECRTILNSRNPAAKPVPQESAQATADAIKASRADAQNTIARITGNH